VKGLFGVFRMRLGHCPVCRRGTIFLARNEWLRDHYQCLRCKSIHRFRAMIRTLELYLPNWRNLKIHESSPFGAASEMIARECNDYVATHYYPGGILGEFRGKFRNENLENQTFDQSTFDIVITQDVFEHILHPDRAFNEIARTLKPGGAHVFTVPWYRGQKTVVRAHEIAGVVEHLLPAEYHGNPINESGSLVTREWGYDLFTYILEASNMHTATINLENPHLGIEAEFLEIFISRKVKLEES